MTALDNSARPFRTLRRELHEKPDLEIDPEKIVAGWDYVAARGVHRRLFRYPWTDLNQSGVLRSMRLFAEELMPAFP